jgi:hypothetical protein
LTLLPPLPKEGPLVAEAASSDPEAPETVKSQSGDKVEGSLEGSDSTQSPPPAKSEEQDAGKKRKCQEDLIFFGYIKIERCTPGSVNLQETTCIFVCHA